MSDALGRHYSLQGKSKQRRDDQSADGKSEMPDRVQLGGGFSRSKLRDGLPVGQRLESLRNQVTNALESGASDQALDLLHQIVAIAPRHAFALRKLVEIYREKGDQTLVKVFKRRLDDVSPY